MAVKKLRFVLHNGNNKDGFSINYIFGSYLIKVLFPLKCFMSNQIGHPNFWITTIIIFIS